MATNTITYSLNSSSYSAYTTTSAEAKSTGDGTFSFKVANAGWYAVYGNVSYGISWTYNSGTYLSTSNNGMNFTVVNGAPTCSNVTVTITLSSTTTTRSGITYYGETITKTFKISIYAPYELSTHYTTSTCTTTGTNYYTYGVPVVSIGSGLTASGGNATVTCYAPNTGLWYQKWTNGAIKAHNGETFNDTAKWRITTNGNSRFSHPSSGSSTLTYNGNTVTVYGTGSKITHSDMLRNEVTDTVTVTAYNVASTSYIKSESASVTNSLGTTKYKNTSGTKGYNITTAGTPSVSIGSGMTAGGGSAVAVTCSVTNNISYYLKYSSGYYTYSIQTGTASGTAVWNIYETTSTAGGSTPYFSYYNSPSGDDGSDGSSGSIGVYYSSGSRITHRNMTTYAGTDTVRIKAYNLDDSSKQSTTYTNIVNSVTNSNYLPSNYTVSVSFGDDDIDAGGGGAEVMCYGSHKAYNYYTSGSYGNQHNVTDTAKWRITNNGNDRFYPDGTPSTISVSGSNITVYNAGESVYHYDMDTYQGIDHLEITAYNCSNTATTATLEKYIDNDYDDVWNNPSISVYTYPNIGAGGGTSTPTVTASQSGTRYWDSGVNESLSNSTFNKMYSMTTGNGFSINTSTGVITAESRGTTAGAARSSNTATVTVSANGKGSTKTATCTQNANSVTNSNYSPSNYTASVSIGSGMTAAGGSATVTASASHLAYDYYTSGSYNNQHTVTDSVSWAITNQTFTSSDPENPGSYSTSAFSKSGNTLTIEDMGKSVGTAYVKITATNGNNSSATAIAEKSIVNSVSLTISCSTPFTYSTTTPVTVTASYTSGTVENNVQESLDITDEGNWIIYSSNKECVEVFDA